MLITLTSIRLKSVWKYFPLTFNSLQIVMQCRKSPGFISMKNTGFGIDHYTMSTWNSEEERQAFYRSGAHAAAMKKSADLASEIRTYNYEADKYPDWKTAKTLLQEKGKIMRF